MDARKMEAMGRELGDAPTDSDGVRVAVGVDDSDRDEDADGVSDIVGELLGVCELLGLGAMQATPEVPEPRFWTQLVAVQR
jgi:hypothetical protein